jgi:AmmeMemoRadiSam system protein B/AmmeMemoRadiSam system protein A
MTFRTYLLICVAAVFPVSASASAALPVKEPAVAGSFYSADPVVLKKEIDGWLAAAAGSRREERPVAVVAPHAGHVYSGSVAAYSFVQLRDRYIRTVYLIGPAHRALLDQVTVYPDGSWRSPLGVIPIDSRKARSLLDEGSGIIAQTEPFSREHSLEVQLPFLQRVLGKFTLIPILVGDPTSDSFTTLSTRLATALRSDPHAILVISTDLSHYHDRTSAGRLDSRVTDALTRMAGAELERLLGRGDAEACGGWPLLIGMAAARGAGATTGSIYRYADSGNVSGDTSKVVGYAAAGFYRTPLTPLRKAALVTLAQTALTAAVTGNPLPSPPDTDPLLRADGAAFVTLTTADGNLRGCIGHILPSTSLARSVIDNAAAAALHDSRFPPVTARELPGLRVEVTVLSPLEPVADPAEIIIGTHGVYLELGPAGSVFLPQVPMEQKWDRRTYLEQLAKKAGLPPDDWKKARLSRFTAEVFR